MRCAVFLASFVLPPVRRRRSTRREVRSLCELRLRERMPCAAVLRLVGSYVPSDRIRPGSRPMSRPRTRWYTYSHLPLVPCRARARVHTCKYTLRAEEFFLSSDLSTDTHTCWLLYVMDVAPTVDDAMDVALRPPSSSAVACAVPPLLRPKYRQRATPLPVRAPPHQPRAPRNPLKPLCTPAWRCVSWPPCLPARSPQQGRGRRRRGW